MPPEFRDMLREQSGEILEEFYQSFADGGEAA